jgi:hypothetical protein
VQSLAQSGYTAAQVDAALHAPSRQIRFRYHLLDAANGFKQELTNVLMGGTLTHDAFATIKGTAKFTIREDGSADIDYLSDRVRPFIDIRMPDGGWVAFNMGVFLLSSPSAADGDTGIVRSVDAYDTSVVLIEDIYGALFEISPGVNVVDTIVGILTDHNISSRIVPSAKTMGSVLTIDPGTTVQTVVGKLLDYVNYTSITYDGDGVAVAGPYVPPTPGVFVYTYATDALSVIVPGATEDLDLYSVPNRWIRVVSETDRDPMQSTFTNTNPASPTSTVRRGRVIVDYGTENVADQAALDAKVRLIAARASQVYAEVVFTTAIMPMHEDADDLQLIYDPLGISSTFREHSWEIQLSPGGNMTHKVRQSVSVS